MKVSTFAEAAETRRIRLEEFFDGLAHAQGTVRGEQRHLGSMTAETAETKRIHLEDFFDGLAHTQGIARETQRRLDLHLVTGFSLFNFYQPDENGFSVILKDLLDPDGSHGQEGRFLAAFLQELQSDRLPQGSALRFIAREQWALWAGRARRIDLCLRFDRPADHVLVIENKLWAADQDKQVADYIAWLEARHRDRWTFVYLSPTGRDPRSLGSERCRDLKATQRLIPLAYCSRGSDSGRSIEAWCQRCQELAQAPHVRWFLRDLVTFVRERFPACQGTSA